MKLIFNIILLAIVQGITEFLPISSSGHLVILKSLFGFKSPGVGLEVSLHFGTLIAIVIFYWSDIKEITSSFFRTDLPTRHKSRRTALYVIIATIPIAIIGILFNGRIISLFTNSFITGVFLLITGLILLSTKLIKPQKQPITVVKSIIIGISQALAILPGISRSGSTISVGKFVGIAPSEAAKFSFLMAIPAITGAIIYEIISNMADFNPLYFIGIGVSAVIGYFSLKILINLVNSEKLWIFGPYCLLIGLISIVFLR
ncbi:undecaprenyl-diphosphate phosphatase [bacterium]|nr:undecaprenyl-diphosphate phosphatase [bacterium]